MGALLLSAVPWLGDSREIWLDEVRAWLRAALGEELAPGAELEPVRERPWSIVLRVPTRHDRVYFKAAAPGGRHEPALLAALARRFGDRVPTPLAIEASCGWMLLPDHGRTLREVLGGADGLEAFERLLPRYAELQIASSSEPARWLGLGVPDRRLERLPELAAALLRDDGALCVGREGGITEAERTALRALLPQLGDACRELAALPHPAALEHGDLHDGNVLVSGDAQRIFDWGDASLGHPFASLLVVCHSLVGDFTDPEGRRRAARLRDAYLEPWSAIAPAPSLRGVFARALWIGHLGRALDWHHMLHGTGAAGAEWLPRVAGWLRLWLERRELLRGGWPERLG